MNDFSFFSPTGDELQGTLETMQGAASVRFETPDRLFSHTGANTEFHNGMKTNEIQGVPLFVDASGEEWLLHHLIPQDEPLTQATIDLLNHEYHIGMALEAARNLKSAVGSISTNYIAPALASLPDAIRDLEQSYRAAKALSISAIERELAMRAAEEEPA